MDTRTPYWVMANHKLPPGSGGFQGVFQGLQKIRRRGNLEDNGEKRGKVGKFWEYKRRKLGLD